MQADYSAGVDLMPPTITFDNRLSLNLGDVSVNLFSFGHWHSAADTIISIPEEGVIRLGAILYAGQLPVVRNQYTNERSRRPSWTTGSRCSMRSWHRPTRRRSLFPVMGGR